MDTGEDAEETIKTMQNFSFVVFFSSFFHAWRSNSNLSDKTEFAFQSVVNKSSLGVANYDLSQCRTQIYRFTPGLFRF